MTNSRNQATNPQSKVPMAVATSSGTRQFERKAASHRRFLFGFFRHVVKGADVARGKPAPGRGAIQLRNCAYDTVRYFIRKTSKSQKWLKT